MCTSVGLAAIIATEDQGMMQVQLELDSMSLVNALKSNEYDHSPEPGGILFGEIKKKSAESFRSVRGLGKGVSDKPYPRLCNARRPQLEPRTFLSWR